MKSNVVRFGLVCLLCIGLITAAVVIIKALG